MARCAGFVVTSVRDGFSAVGRRVLVIAVLVAGCARAEVVGQVVDRVTGARLAGARVSAGGATLITGADGVYVLPAAAEIAVARDGYLAMRRVRVAPDESGIDLAMLPERTDPVAERALVPRHAQYPDLDDMRAEARALALTARMTSALTLPAADIGAAPATIRIWRRKLDGSTSSCTGRVDVIALEDYVKGVVPHEWLASWDDRALEMGAVCARTFAWWWVRAGGKYPCADLDDTAASQVYTDGRVDKTAAAVDRTRGLAIVKDGALVLAEYSAENGDPTAFGVDEPYCAGKPVSGHGPGTCQWGTQRWATNEDRDFRWMVPHYDPGATVYEPAALTWLASLPAPPAPLALAAGRGGDRRGGGRQRGHRVVG